MYNNIDEIISEAKASGSHFFDESAMRFFSSRILPTIYGGCYFITSERDSYRDTNPRFYTIRKYNGGLNISDVGGHCAYKTRKQAISVVTKLVKQEKNNKFLSTTV